MTNRSGNAVSIAVLLAGAIVSSAHGQPANGAPAPVRAGASGPTMADAVKMPDLFNGMWATFDSMVENDETLNVPYTEKAQKFVDGYKPLRDIPYAQDGCRSPGLPIAMRSGPIKFSYSPGLISIYMQGVGDTRFIEMDEEMGHTTPKYYGNSVGHWEGDTLVIETQDFLKSISFQYGVGKGLPPEQTFGPGAPPGGGSGPPPGGGPAKPLPGIATMNLSKAIWGPPGEKMRMVERIRLTGPDSFELKLTLYDDTVWKKPFVAETRTYNRAMKGGQGIGRFLVKPEEWVCTVSITSFDPATNTYVDKDPEEMVKFLDEADN